MRLLASDLGPAKIGFLCYPFPSLEVTPLLDRLGLRPDTCGLSNCSHLTLFQVQFVSRAMTLNNRRSDFLAERIKKECIHRSFCGCDRRRGKLRCEIDSLIRWFCAPRVHAGKNL
jgi:hypothetical protein